MRKLIIQWSEVSGTEFDDEQHRENAVETERASTQNDFMSMHGVPSSEVVNKEAIKTRWKNKVKLSKHDLS